MSKLSIPVQEWLKDLRSGEFNQSTYSLREIDENGEYAYCCLGVAIETYKRVTDKTPVFVLVANDNDDTETLLHFPEVQEWLGLNGPVGEVVPGEYKPYWHACEVIAYHNGFAVLWDSHELEYFKAINPDIFRPVKSEREKFIEATSLVLALLYSNAK